MCRICVSVLALGMNIVINPDYLDLSYFVKQLPSIFVKEGDMIYEARNQIKKFRVQDIDVVVKCYKIPIFINRIIYTLFRPSKAKRAYEYAISLLDKGIRTPQPIAYVEVKKNLFFYQGYFISRREEYPRMMREFYNAIGTGEHILKEFAKFTLKVHEAGILHLDYSPGNILFEEVGNEVHFSLVDLNRMRFGTLSEKECLSNFDRISLSDEVTSCIVAEYSRLRGWDVADSVKTALCYKAKFWKKVAKKTALKNKMRKEHSF